MGPEIGQKCRVVIGRDGAGQRLKQPDGVVPGAPIAGDAGAYGEQAHDQEQQQQWGKHLAGAAARPGSEACGGGEDDAQRAGGLSPNLLMPPRSWTPARSRGRSVRWM